MIEKKHLYIDMDVDVIIFIFIDINNKIKNEFKIINIIIDI